VGAGLAEFALSRSRTSISVREFARPAPDIRANQGSAMYRVSEARRVHVLKTIEPSTPGPRLGRQPGVSGSQLVIILLVAMIIWIFVMFTVIQRAVASGIYMALINLANRSRASDQDAVESLQALATLLRAHRSDGEPSSSTSC
jgi:hypothetical protein